MSERRVDEQADWQGASHAPWENGAAGGMPGTPPNGRLPGEATTQWTPEWADPTRAAAAHGAPGGNGATAQDIGEMEVGRRSLYEELGLSLDVYDNAEPAGGDRTLAGLLDGPQEIDFAGGHNPSDPASLPFLPGSLGSETVSLSFTGSYDPPAPGVAPEEALEGIDAAPAPAWVDAAPPVDPPRASRGGSASQPESRPTAASLTADRVLRQRGSAPKRGWRKAVLNFTGGQVNLGPSPRERRERELHKRVRTPIHGCQRLAVISLKGGVGKTTTVAALGSMFASLRGDRVIAVDANPDRGTLGEKIVGDTHLTVRDFVGRSPRLHRYADVRELTMQAPSRLEVLASETDPLASMAFSEQDYRIVSDVLERFYSLIITDCGTGLLHSAMVGVLAMAESIVVVSSASLDGARSASATLDWLEAHGYTELSRGAVAVISAVRPQAADVQLEEIEDHFAARCRSVVRVPYDPHLSAGGRIDLERLHPRTYEAYLHLAAEVGDNFGRLRRLH